MLTTEAIESAYALTEKLDQSGMVLRPVDNTPLAALVKASRQPGEMMLPVAGDYTPDIQSIVYMANTPMPEINASVHDMCTDEIVPVVINAVREHLVFARTVVAPAVESLADAVRQSLADQSASSLLGMEVIVEEMPALVSNPLLATAVRPYTETPFDHPRLAFKCPDQTATELRETMSAGSGRLDKDVDEWLAIKGEGWLLNLWRQAFQNGVNGEEVGTITFSDLMKDLDSVIAIFLLSRKLYSASPLEGTEMGLKAYEALMVEFRNQSARTLAVALELYEADVKGGALVRSNTERTITVNSEVYRQWIEAGGTNEVLYGNLLSKPVLGSVASINENAGRLLKAWNEHSTYVASAEANRRFERTKQFLSLHFHKQLQEDTDTTNIGNSATVFNTFIELLEGVRSQEMDCIDSLALRLVCGARFPHTAAYTILDGVNAAITANPKLDVREAAAISAARYAAKWVAEQFKVGV